MIQNSTLEGIDHPRYRWGILTLAAFTNMLVVAAPGMSMSVLFKEISQDLGLNLVEIGLIWGISSLPGIISILLGGAAGDRFGPKRILIFACLVSGIAGALRGLALDFAAIFGAALLLGFLTPFVIMNNLKACSTWFSSEELGLANGVLSAGMAAGFLFGSLLSATWLSPLLGGWRNVMLFFGAIAMLFSLPWIFTQPAPRSGGPPARPQVGVSIRRGIRHVAGIGEMWLLGLSILGISGCIQGTLGYLPLHLREIGWQPVAADGALAIFHTCSLIFVIPIALWSDRLGNRKKLLLTATLMMGLGIGLLSIADGWLVWAAVCLAGMVRDGFMAVFITTIIETKGVGSAFSGTGTGFVLVFSSLGNLAAPAIGNSLATTSPGLPFIFWSSLTVLSFVGLGAIRR